jgi:hypothetical protein
VDESRQIFLYSRFAKYPTYYKIKGKAGEKDLDAEVSESLRRLSLQSSSTAGLDELRDRPSSPASVESASNSSTPSTAELKDNDRAKVPVGDMQGDGERSKTASERSEDQQEPITTYMFRNLPSWTTPDLFMKHLEATGLGDTYDYLFMPQCRQNRSYTTRERDCKGYVFVNFTKRMEVSDLQAWLSKSTFERKDRMVVRAASHQGVLKNLEPMYSVSADKNEEVTSLFSPVWIRVNGVMQAMEAPRAYDAYKAMHTSSARELF